MSYDKLKFEKSSKLNNYKPNISKVWELKTNFNEEDCEEEKGTDEYEECLEFLYNENLEYTDIILKDELGQEVSVKPTQLMVFIIKNKFKIVNNKITGTFIVDSYGDIHLPKVYNEWLKIKNKNKTNEIKKNDLKVGYVYQLETKNDYFLYLGTKFIVSWKHNKKTNEIEMSKVQKKYIGYTVYKNDKYDNSQVYFKSKIFLTTNKVIKEVKKYDEKHSIDTLLNHIKYSMNIMYMENEKPNFELDLQMKELKIEDLFEIRKKYNIRHIDIFHSNDDSYILNHYLIPRENKQKNNDDSYYREVQKYSNPIFQHPFQNEMLIDNNADFEKFTLDYEENYHFRLAPKNYYMLSVK